MCVCRLWLYACYVRSVFLMYAVVLFDCDISVHRCVAVIELWVCDVMTLCILCVLVVLVVLLCVPDSNSVDYMICGVVNVVVVCMCDVDEYSYVSELGDVGNVFDCGVVVAIVCEYVDVVDMIGSSVSAQLAMQIQV